MNESSSSVSVSMEPVGLGSDVGSPPNWHLQGSWEDGVMLSVDAFPPGEIPPMSAWEDRAVALGVLFAVMREDVPGKMTFVRYRTLCQRGSSEVATREEALAVAGSMDALAYTIQATVWIAGQRFASWAPVVERLGAEVQAFVCGVPVAAGAPAKG